MEQKWDVDYGILNLVLNHRRPGMGFHDQFVIMRLSVKLLKSVMVGNIILQRIISEET